MLEYSLQSFPLWQGARQRVAKEEKFMKKNNRGIRTVFTTGVLLVLVIAAAWTLKHRKADEPANAEIKIETPAPVEAPQPAEKPAEEATVDPAAEQAAKEEAARQEQEKSTFATDYESEPLLNTTPIKYLSLEVGSTEDEIRLNWMSPSAATGQVSWYTVQNGDFQMVDAECSASQTMPGYYVNKATVTGLQRGMTYAYKVGNDAGGWSPEYKYTVPDVDTKEGFTFLVTSDAEIGQDQYQEEEVTVNDWDKVVTRLTNYVPEAQFLVHAGDQVAQFGNAEEYSGFLDHLGLYKIPLVPVTGNHDVANDDIAEELGYNGGPFFYEHFNVPNRSEHYGMSELDKDGDYYFVRGDVLFIVLNSLTAQETDTHEDYVPKVVEKYPDTKWRIIIQHYPAYSSVKRYQDQMDPWIRKSLAYICQDNDIDLVISGHDAVYSRSYFTNRNCEKNENYDYSSGATAVNPEGTMYVVCSTASGSLYQAATPNENIVFQGQPEEPMALRFDVTENELHLQAYTVDNWTLYDEYTIRKE